jgi:hypothetical protein
LYNVSEARMKELREELKAAQVSRPLSLPSSFSPVLFCLLSSFPFPLSSRPLLPSRPPPLGVAFMHGRVYGRGGLL